MLNSQIPYLGCRNLEGGWGPFEIGVGGCDWRREGGAAREDFVEINLKARKK